MTKAELHARKLERVRANIEAARELWLRIMAVKEAEREH